MLKGRILLAASRDEEAYATLREAHQIATKQQAKPMLWQICAFLADLESERGDKAEAQALREQAREAIDYIAEHAGTDDLRTTFLALPKVQTILKNQTTQKTK